MNLAAKKDNKSLTDIVNEVFPTQSPYFEEKEERVNTQDILKDIVETDKKDKVLQKSINLM